MRNWYSIARERHFGVDLVFRGTRCVPVRVACFRDMAGQQPKTGSNEKAQHNDYDGEPMVHT